MLKSLKIVTAAFSERQNQLYVTTTHIPYAFLRYEIGLYMSSKGNSGDRLDTKYLTAWNCHNFFYAFLAIRRIRECIATFECYNLTI